MSYLAVLLWCKKNTILTYEHSVNSSFWACTWNKDCSACPKDQHKNLTYDMSHQHSTLSKQWLSSLRMKNKVVEHDPRMTHVTQVMYMTHETYDMVWDQVIKFDSKYRNFKEAIYDANLAWLALSPSHRTIIKWKNAAKIVFRSSSMYIYTHLP